MCAGMMNDNEQKLKQDVQTEYKKKLISWKNGQPVGQVAQRG